MELPIVYLTSVVIRLVVLFQSWQWKQEGLPHTQSKLQFIFLQLFGINYILGTMALPLCCTEASCETSLFLEKPYKIAVKNVRCARGFNIFVVIQNCIPHAFLSTQDGWF